MRRKQRFRVAASLLLVVAVGYLARGDKQPQPTGPLRQPAADASRGNDSHVTASPQSVRPSGETAADVSRRREASRLELRVVGVHDGDTLTGLSAANEQVKVRLDAIDAPELGQPFGQKAKQALSDKVFGRQVVVQRKTVDRYGRTIGHVLLEGRDVNLELLEEGMAWHYKHFDHNARLAAAETAARAAGKGLWAEPTPIAPWDWRQLRKAKPAAAAR